MKGSAAPGQSGGGSNRQASSAAAPTVHWSGVYGTTLQRYRCQVAQLQRQVLLMGQEMKVCVCGGGGTLCDQCG